MHCSYSLGSLAGSASPAPLLWKHCWRQAGMLELFSLFLSTCSCFGWKLFSRLATRPEKHQQRPWSPVQAFPMGQGGAVPTAQQLPVALQVHVHGFSYTLVSTTLPCLGTWALPINHRWCLETSMSMWYCLASLQGPWLNKREEVAAVLHVFCFPFSTYKISSHK